MDGADEDDPDPTLCSARALAPVPPPLTPGGVTATHRRISEKKSNTHPNRPIKVCTKWRTCVHKDTDGESEAGVKEDATKRLPWTVTWTIGLRRRGMVTGAPMIAYVCFLCLVI